MFPTEELTIAAVQEQSVQAASRQSRVIDDGKRVVEGWPNDRQAVQAVELLSPAKYGQVNAEKLDDEEWILPEIYG